MTTASPKVGNWWISDKPNHKVPGQLTLEDGMWTLETLGQLGTETTSTPRIATTTIHATTTTGDLTLLNCARTSWSPRSEKWVTFRAITGPHLTPDTRWTSAKFTFTHLDAWFSTGTRRPSPDYIPQPLTAQLAPGLQLQLVYLESRHFRATEETWRVEPAYVLSSESSTLSLEQIDQTVWGLQRLHSIVIGHPLNNSNLTLHLVGPTQIPSSNVELEARQDDLPATDFAFINTAAIEFTTFIPNWLALARSIPSALGIAAPPPTHASFVQTVLVDAASALEALAEHTADPPQLTSADVALMQILNDGDIGTRDQRRFIATQLRRRQTNLQSKLVTLANLIGPASWLLGDNLNHWASVVARLRNAHAHGLKLPDPAADLEMLISSSTSALVVLRLALLRTAGFDKALTPSPRRSGNYLEVAGRGHLPYTRLDDQIASVRAYASRWQTWKQLLDEA